MNKTGIQWTNYTLQLVRFRSKLTGRVLNWCHKISAGCQFCYAERVTVGWPGLHGRQHSYTAAGGELVEPFLDRDALRELVTTRRRGMVFVEDMSDLFGDWVPDAWLAECFSAFAASPLTIQVLTKRAERMSQWLEWASQRGLGRGLGGSRIAPYGWKDSGTDELRARAWPLPNVWLGVSVEDQQRADERIPDLLATPAAVRFLSVEPMLGPIRFPTRIWAGAVAGHGDLHWCIVGGESGPKARPCNVAWIRSIRDQCRAAGVACFVKQVGSWPVIDRKDDRMCTCIGGCNGRGSLGVGWGCALENGRLNIKDSHGGDPEEWPVDLRVRELPQTAASPEDAQPHRRQSRRSAPAESNGATTVPLHRGRPRRSRGAA